MSEHDIVLRGGRVIDPETGLDAVADVAITGATISAVVPGGSADLHGRVEWDVSGRVVSPGFIDLQVNGAGGVQIDGTTDLAGLTRVCGTLARLGATGCLPTLITAAPAATEAMPSVGMAAGEMTASSTAMRKNMTPHAACMALTQAPRMDGCSRANRPSASVAAVDEARPPSKPVHRMPRCGPLSRMAKCPVRDKAAIRMMAHQSL